MAGQQPNKPRHTKMLLDKELAHIFELMVVGHSDMEIQRMLNINERTYYFYKHRLNERYGSLQRQKTEDYISYQQQILTDRLLKLYRMTEQKLTKDMSKMNGMEITALTETAQEIAINVFRLEAEGFRAVNMKRMSNNVQQEISQYLGYDPTNNNNIDSSSS